MWRAETSKAYIHAFYNIDTKRMELNTQAERQVRLQFLIGQILGINPELSEKPIRNKKDAFSKNVNLTDDLDRREIYC